MTDQLLVLAEANGNSVLPATLSAISFAQHYHRLTGTAFSLLLMAADIASIDPASWQHFGASELLIVASDHLAHPAADQVSELCSAIMEDTGAQSIAAASTSFGKDTIPRVAELRSLPMVSDVIALNSDTDGKISFKRPMYAGNLIATISVDGAKAAFTVRTTAFGSPVKVDAVSQIRLLSVPVPVSRVMWVASETSTASRPDLTTARAVVSGGRPLKDAATFEALIGGLADKLGGAAGATRAAVDSGIAPNELQVGQTGKVVAPDLYIAAGISGSIQHIAGMKDSKRIVAINTDPDAPIFQVADIGLVADLFTVVPILIDKL